MPISCIYGLPGKGKTQFSLFYAIALAEKYSKNIVSNFSLNIQNLTEYCRLMRYESLLKRLTIPHAPCIFYVDMEQENVLDNILTIPNSIIIIDESGAYIRARGSTTSTPKKFLKDLTQVRHRRQYCLFIAQSEKQIDSAIKVLADEIIYCDGISIYDAKIDAPRLQLKTVRRFTPDKYEIFSDNPRLRGNPIKAYLSANKNWIGVPTISNIFLFSVYDSFGLVHDDNQKQTSQTQTSKNRRLTQADLDALRGHKQLAATSAIASNCFLPVNPVSFQTIKISSKIVSFLFQFLPSDFLPLIYNLRRIFYKNIKGFDLKNRYHRFTLCLLFGSFVSFLLLGLSLLFFILSHIF